MFNKKKNIIYRVVDENSTVEINGKEYTVTNDNSVKHGSMIFLTQRSYNNRKDL